MELQLELENVHRAVAMVNRVSLELDFDKVGVHAGGEDQIIDDPTSPGACWRALILPRPICALPNEQRRSVGRDILRSAASGICDWCGCLLLFIDVASPTWSFVDQVSSAIPGSDELCAASVGKFL